MQAAAPRPPPFWLPVWQVLFKRNVMGGVAGAVLYVVVLFAIRWPSIYDDPRGRIFWLAILVVGGILWGCFAGILSSLGAVSIGAIVGRLNREARVNPMGATVGTGIGAVLATLPFGEIASGLPIATTVLVVVGAINAYVVTSSRERLR